MSEAEDTASGRRANKRAAVFRTIGEVAEDLDLPAHVLRFWESKFPQLKPLKRGGGRRYYRPEDIALLSRIRQCLYQEGYTIRGVQKLLSDGAGGVAQETAPSLFPLDPLPTPLAAPSLRRQPRMRRAAAAVVEAVEIVVPERASETTMAVVVEPSAPIVVRALSEAGKAQLEAAVQDLLSARQLLDGLLGSRRRA